MIKTALVSGAGIGGLTAGIALAQHGIGVDIYDQAVALTEIGAGLQLSPNAMQVFQKLGLADAILTKGFEPHFAVMRHYRSGRPYFSAPLKSMCRSRYGAPYVHIHRSDLQQILVHKAKAMGVKIHLDHKVTGYQQSAEKVTLLFSDKSSVTGDLVIGADGLHSVVRDQMLGPERPRFTGQTAWRGTVATADLPKDLIAPDVNVWIGSGRHVVAYYISGGDKVNFVAVEEQTDQWNEDWRQKGKLSDARAAFSDWSSAVTSLLDAADHVFLWSLYDRTELPHWSEGRVVLLGDACHPTLPFMAQGAALAIEDAYILAACITVSDTSLSDILNYYENLRKSRTTRLQNTARANARLFHMPSGISGWPVQAKLAVSAFLPKRFALKPLDWIYEYDVTKIRVFK